MRRRKYNRTFQRYVFDEKRAKDVIEFIETCCWLSKGEGANKPIKLRPWQKEIIGELFGWIDPATGYRRYRQLFLGIPRKNGKSHLTACIAAVMLYFDDEPGAEVLLCANARDQAAIVFRAVHEMVKRSPILKKRSTLKPSMYVIEVPETSARLKAIASEAGPAYGADPNCIVFDEFSFCNDAEFYSAMATSQGSRRQPLQCYITTAGHDFQGVGFKKWQYAQEVIKDPTRDPTFLAYIFELPMEADWTDEANWFKCNPALNDFRSLSEMQDTFRQSVTVQGQYQFRQLYLNQWMQAPKSWMPRERWDECIAKEGFDEAVLKTAPLFLGMDLSSTQDITGVAGVWDLNGLIDPAIGRYYIRGWSFLPDYDGHLRDKSIKDHAPYQTWVEQGWLSLTPGMAIDQKAVQDKIEEIADLYNLKMVGYDKHAAGMIVQELEKFGLTMTVVRTGALTISEPMKEFERSVLRKSVIHDDDPCLAWQVGNVVPVRDGRGNITWDKDKSQNRIDTICAAIMAFHCAIRTNQEPEKPKQEFRVTVFG